MVADVSGFTALTEALSVQGSVGVELLTRCMNRYFTQVGAVLRPGPVLSQDAGILKGPPFLRGCAMHRQMPHACLIREAYLDPKTTKI